MSLRVLCLAPAVMLILALAPLPYGYYTFLRLVVCICGALIAYEIATREGASTWVVAFAGIALLFNPLIPIHLSRAIWAPIDVACAAIFATRMLIDIRGERQNGASN